MQWLPLNLTINSTQPSAAKILYSISRVVMEMNFPTFLILKKIVPSTFSMAFFLSQPRATPAYISQQFSIAEKLGNGKKKSPHEGASASCKGTTAFSLPFPAAKRRFEGQPQRKHPQHSPAIWHKASAGKKIHTPSRPYPPGRPQRLPYIWEALL